MRAFHSRVLVGPTTRTSVTSDVTLTLTSLRKLEVEAEWPPVAVNKTAKFVTGYYAGSPLLSASSWHSPMGPMEADDPEGGRLNRANGIFRGKSCSSVRVRVGGGKMRPLFSIIFLMK